MSEAAPNVTIPAGAEPKVESRSGSGVNWDQLESAMAASKPAAPKKEAKAPAKTEPKEAKDEGDAKPAAASAKRSDPSGDKQAKKPEVKEKEAEGKDAKEADEKPQEPKPKAKVHRYKAGDKEVEIAGDALFTVPVDGKMEDATLEDLRSSYSGKKYYERKITEVDRRAKEVEQKDQSLNNLASEVFKRANENPESAYDYLAQLSGKDPIEFKLGLFRKQREEAKQLAALSDEEFESFLRQKENDWLKGERTERVTREQQSQEKTQSERHLAELKERYALDDEGYSQASDMARKFLKHQGSEAEPTPEQVIEASRYLLAIEAIEQTVPHLANHAKVGSIVDDLVTDLLKDPTLTRDTVSRVLKENFGQDDDDGTVRRLGRKAQRNAEFDGTQATPKPQAQRKVAVSFDDL